tara:strand:- start:557 stop:820 length:264 start_codon:yes stop_codon:yes gene_type:complete
MTNKEDHMKIPFPLRGEPMEFSPSSLKTDELTAFQLSQLQFLRTEVDRAQDEMLRRDAHPNSKNKLFYAHQELKKFTSDLRAAGKNI